MMHPIITKQSCNLRFIVHSRVAAVCGPYSVPDCVLHARPIEETHTDAGPVRAIASNDHGHRRS